MVTNLTVHLRYREVFGRPCSSRRVRQYRWDATRHYVTRLKHMLRSPHQFATVYLGWSSNCELMLSYWRCSATGQAFINVHRYEPARFVPVGRIIFCFFAQLGCLQYMRLALDNPLATVDAEDSISNVHLNADNSLFVLTTYSRPLVDWLTGECPTSVQCSVQAVLPVQQASQLCTVVCTALQMYMYDFDGLNTEFVCSRINGGIQALPPAVATGYLVNPCVESLTVITFHWAHDTDHSTPTTSQNNDPTTCVFDDYDELSSAPLESARCCRRHSVQYDMRASPVELVGAQQPTAFSAHVQIRHCTTGEDQCKWPADAPPYLCVTQSELKLEEIIDYYGRNMCLGYGYNYCGFDNYLVDALSVSGSAPTVSCLLVASVEAEKRVLRAPSNWKHSALVIELLWDYSQARLLAHKLLRPHYHDLPSLPLGQHVRLHSWWQGFKRAHPLVHSLQRLSSSPAQTTRSTMPFFLGRSLATLSAAHGGIVFVP